MGRRALADIVYMMDQAGVAGSDIPFFIAHEIYSDQRRKALIATNTWHDLYEDLRGDDDDGDKPPKPIEPPPFGQPSVIPQHVFHPLKEQVN